MEKQARSESTEITKEQSVQIPDSIVLMIGKQALQIEFMGLQIAEMQKKIDEAK